MVHSDFNTNIVLLFHLNDLSLTIERSKTHVDENLFSDEEYVQICKPCFDKSPESFIVPNDPSKIRHKTEFKIDKNNIYTDESFISCWKCCRLWHSICAKHITTPESPFVCKACSVSDIIPQKEFSAERIPVTDLSEYIEGRVNNKFKAREEEMDKVIVRVVADSSLEVQVKPEIAKHYKDKSVSSLPYQGKAIYVFQKIEGYEILFFALYTQEYGGNCPSPNTRTVYISYLDSVHYFRPVELRTEVYHEILISYLDFCRNQQFLTAHLWACPPGSGDDYVFHQHPSEQKVPKRNRLINWYKSMLHQAVMDDAVLEYMNIHEYLIENQVVNPADIPYFEGDFWPNAISEMLINDEREPTEEMNTSPKRKKLQKKKVDNTPKDLQTRMYQLTKKFNEEFLVVVLNKKEDITTTFWAFNKGFSLRNTALCEKRDSLLYFCREYNLEFSTLRRAKFTTMRILDELFRENQKESFDCDVCKKSNLSDRYTCSQCLDYDLCPICYDKIGHQHSMERVKQKSGVVTLGDKLKLLNEAIRCKDCRSNRCVMMKLLLLHAQRCKLSDDKCEDCYQYTLLMVSHVRYCRDTNCRIPFCREKREKDKRKESQRLLKQRYNEILRYQATKRNFEDEDSKVRKPESAEVIVSFEELERMGREFVKNYPIKEELRKHFDIFLANNPGYQAANELYTQRKRQLKCTQLGRELNTTTDQNKQDDQLSLANNRSKTNDKPPLVEKEKQRSSYFIKPSPGIVSVQAIIPKIKTEVKPEPLRPQVVVQNQPAAKKRVFISNQN